MSSCKLCDCVNVKNVAIGVGTLAALYFAYKQLAPAPAAAKKKNENLELLVISGPSGTGKGTLQALIGEAFPDCFATSVSHTSRAPRAGEQNGREYHFAKKEEMEAMDAKGEFLELCNVHGNLYGTSKAAVKKAHESGKFCIIECDVNGSQKIRESLAKTNDFNAAFMFIEAPSLEALRARILGRGSETDETIQKRLKTAETEMAFRNSEKGKKHFDFVLMNDDLERAHNEFVKFLQDKKAVKGEPKQVDFSKFKKAKPAAAAAAAADNKAAAAATTENKPAADGDKK